MVRFSVLGWKSLKLGSGSLDWASSNSVIRVMWICENGSILKGKGRVRARLKSKIYGTNYKQNCLIKIKYENYHANTLYTSIHIAQFVPNLLYPHFYTKFLTPGTPPTTPSQRNTNGDATEDAPSSPPIAWTQPYQNSAQTPTSPALPTHTISPFA